MTHISSVPPSSPSPSVLGASLSAFALGLVAGCGIATWLSWRAWTLARRYSRHGDDDDRCEEHADSGRQRQGWQERSSGALQASRVRTHDRGNGSPEEAGTGSLAAHSSTAAPVDSGSARSAIPPRPSEPSDTPRSVSLAERLEAGDDIVTEQLMR